ncbi:MAG: PTS galactitol transporter subunit IIC [Treponema sp.]|jgi:PTS system galactitol-specific IIC component|nr:PTS galactitol transporter subunit IIC [Treponema sp.]
MQAFQSAVQFILGFGVSVILPLIIFIFGLAMGAGFNRSLRSGITIGIGFIGINLVIGLLTGSLAPAAKAMMAKLGLNLTIVDIGWPAMSAVSWAWTFAGLMIPIVLVINFIMIALKLTKTMDIDIWNYWQFAFIGAAVYGTSQSHVWGIAAGIIGAIIALLLADYTQKYIEKYFNMPGISFPHLTALGFMPLVIPLNWILDHVPGLNKLHVDPETIRKRFGLFGEPMLLGIIIGAIIGILAGKYSDQNPVQSTLILALNMGAVMFIMPKMVAILMEGLIPISEAAREFMSRHFKGREIYIGLDAAVSLGEPSVIAVGLIMVPITIALAFIIPGNRLLPLADLAVIPFIVCLITAMSKGNIIRSLIVSTIVMALVLVFATNLAPAETYVANAMGINVANFTSEAMQGYTGNVTATEIGNLDRANLITWVLVKLFSIF